MKKFYWLRTVYTDNYYTFDFNNNNKVMTGCDIDGYIHADYIMRSRDNYTSLICRI